MKQFGKILKFELKSYVKNKAFVGITIFLVLLIAAVMFFPRIAVLFKSDNTTDTPDELSVMLIKAENSAQADMVKEIFANAFTDYDVQITNDSVDEIKSKITSGEAECAFVMTGQPAPVFLPWKSHAQSLVGCSPWCHRVEHN